MCDTLEPTDTGVPSMFGGCDSLGTNAKLRTKDRFINFRMDGDFISNVTVSCDCCEHLDSRLKFDTTELMPEVTLRNSFVLFN